MATAQKILDPTFLKKLERLSIASKRVFAGQSKGERRSTKRGSSVEFADYREYALGDDLRYVDWKAYGRLEKLFLKLYVEEEDLNIHLLIDSSKSMDFGTPMTKAVYALRAAAAIGFIALSESDRVTVGSFNTVLGERMPPARGKPGLIPFFRFLEDRVPIGGGTRFGEAVSQYAARAKNVGIAVIISDFFDDSYLIGIKALLARKYQIVLLQVLDEEEMHPSLVGDLRLLDAETGEYREVSMSPQIIARYQAELAAFYDELQKLSLRYGMDYVRASTSMPLENVIMKYLRTGGFIR